MSIDKALVRYVVRIPYTMPLADAVAMHRDRTGHGGMCMLVFEKGPRRRYRRPITPTSVAHAA
jgi:hypothetical protein